MTCTASSLRKLLCGAMSRHEAIGVTFNPACRGEQGSHAARPLYDQPRLSVVPVESVERDQFGKQGIKLIPVYSRASPTAAIKSGWETLEGSLVSPS
ncbi:hypothetical protein PoB_006442500 [Plakobranchus ocellatus]|uniref:Uncharacterized protein n=1 Tax=Plakobranchus ocellatus TaxID=259542 RepID=A0AAV4D1M2_9GAST|nr:hypothetical protein PoB_006442500 [Plakobranchus ocellatus]